MLLSEGIELSQWGADPGSNKVNIQLSRVSNIDVRRLLQLYGAKWITVDRTPDHQVGYLRDRFSDTSPFYGGDAIWPSGFTPQTYCTSGFPLLDMNADYLMTTAGHCANSTTWMTNYLQPQPLGRTYNNYGPLPNGGVDTQTMKTTVLGIIWGPGTTEYTLTNELNPVKGNPISFDGAYSGEQTNVPITDPGPFCKTFGTATYCNLGVATRASGTAICLGGDSGGPVYQRKTSPNIWAVGTITGSNASGLTCWYTRIQEITTVAKATLVTG